MCRNSTLSDFKKFLLAGTLKNKFFTSKEEPVGQVINSCLVTLLPSICIKFPNSSVSSFVLSDVCEIADIEANASPLNPFVDRWNKSAAFSTLLVA